MQRKNVWIFLLCALAACVLAVPSWADTPSLTVETAYLFALPHGVPPNPDGGSVLIINNSASNVEIDHVILTGWSNGTTFDFGPAASPCCGFNSLGGLLTALMLAPGAQSEYNQAASPYPADTSNYGTLSNPAQGLTITVEGVFNGTPFTLTYFDNVTYALTGCTNTGADQECNGTTGIGYGATTVPEPSTIALLLPGLAGLGLLRRRFFQS